MTVFAIHWTNNEMYDEHSDCIMDDEVYSTLEVATERRDQLQEKFDNGPSASYAHDQYTVIHFTVKDSFKIKTKIMYPASIGEMVDSSEIENMNNFIKNHGYQAFQDAVYHGAFSEVAYAYVHPCNEMRSTDNFSEIQKAFFHGYT